MKQVVAVIDERTTMVCLRAAGQIQPVDRPFNTLNGPVMEPPFHYGCRSISVPFMRGFVNDAKRAANEEIMRRPEKERRYGEDGYKGKVPPLPPSQVEAQAVTAAPSAPQAPSTEVSPVAAAAATQLVVPTDEEVEAAREASVEDAEELDWYKRGAKRRNDRSSLDAYLNNEQYTSLRNRYEAETEREGREVLDSGYFANDESFAINQAMRTGKAAAYAGIIAKMQAAVRAWLLPAPTRTYRGMWNMGGLPDDLVGTIWNDKAFQSTTFNRGAALSWAVSRSSGGENCVLMEIVTPAGTPVAIGHDQLELLLPDDAKLLIVGDTVEDFSGNKVRVLKCVVQSV